MLRPICRWGEIKTFPKKLSRKLLSTELMVFEEEIRAKGYTPDFPPTVEEYKENGVFKGYIFNFYGYFQGKKKSKKAKYLKLDKLVAEIK